MCVRRFRSISVCCDTATMLRSDPLIQMFVQSIREGEGAALGGPVVHQVAPTPSFCVADSDWLNEATIRWRQTEPALPKASTATGTIKGRQYSSNQNRQRCRHGKVAGVYVRLFPCLRGFGENVRPFTPRFRFFFFFYQWKLARVR